MDYLLFGAIGCGLLAWVAPLLAMGQFEKKKDVQGTSMQLASLVSAIFSLLCVITYRNYLIHMEDFSALVDTTRGFQFASLVMIVVALGMNSLAVGFKLKQAKI